jgi:hypothetical protein
MQLLNRLRLFNLAQENVAMEADDVQEDFDREHQYAQRALQRKSIKIPDGKTLRYEFTYDESYYDCDKVWIDRLTGREVFRYDAADPANTNSYYGARPDEESFIARGLDIYETIFERDAKPLPVFPRQDLDY